MSFSFTGKPSLCLVIFYQPRRFTNLKELSLVHKSTRKSLCVWYFKRNERKHKFAYSDLLKLLGHRVTEDQSPSRDKFGLKATGQRGRINSQVAVVIAFFVAN